MSDDEATIKLGNIEIVTPKSKAKRLSLLIWGSSGGGKTTLAATAPGQKLWISFDPDGTDAIAYRDDIQVMDFAIQPNACVEKFKEDDPLRLVKYLTDHPEIETIVFDSLTTFGDKALFHGIIKAQGTAKGKYATVEDPGYSGYGNKNTWTRLCVKNLLKSTGQVNRNIIFIAHEDKAQLDKEGNIAQISIMLGSSLNEQIPIDLSEIWHLSDTGRYRRIAVRNSRNRKPMKSRMFITSGDPEFIWNYNADTDEGDGIDTWYKAWVANKGKKIELPK
jgi:hypothetical protein